MKFMNWGERTVSEELRVDRYTVNDIIVNYLQDSFYVNRRYQRKLVWGVKEKRLLIDSMLKKIPLPAILIVKFDIPSQKKNILEIVDGMQRLNAIISFVLGEFGIMYENKMCYFDPNSNNETFQLLMDNDKRIRKQNDYLPKDVCLEFCRYQLPVIITGQDNATVDMIFSRINSTGRKISSQDLRQSMATGEFADLVRRVASDVRLDNTYDDHICLCDMPKISIGYKQYGYGVDLNNIFWRRHDLINIPNIKESKDEEIIETLIATILLGTFKRNKESLDNLYIKGNELYDQIEAKVIEMGKDLLEEKFKKVFDTIDIIFDSVHSDFSSYIFDKKNTKNKDECFKILFLTLYKLIFEGYVVANPQVIAQSIKSSQIIFKDFTEVDKVDYDKFHLAVDNLYRLLKPSFSKAVPKISNEMTQEINKRLSYAKIERQMTEFKVGISNFTSDTVNKNVIEDIAKTLVAMANSNNAKEEGLIILGIANDRKSYDDWFNVFKEQAVINNQHYIPGITKEAQKLYGNIDLYYRRLREFFKNEPISPKLKKYVLETFEPFDYYDTELIIFRSKYMEEVSLYNGEKYVRNSNETIKV
jgi:Protein of unknown function DUF262.